MKWKTFLDLGWNKKTKVFWKENDMKKKKEKELLMQEILEGYLGEVSEVPAEENFFGEEKFEEEEPFEKEEEKLENGKEELFKAAEVFAKAFEKKPEEILEIFGKGLEFDGISEELGKAKNDSEVFEKLAQIRGISKDEMKEEILWALEKAVLEKSIAEIMAANPGMNRENAKELATFRLEVNKAKKEEQDDGSEAMLSELENFLARHSGEGIEKLDNGIVEEWERGIPLETAFEKFRLGKEKEELLKEVEKMKKEQTREAQKNYAREHSTGSATSAAGISGLDEFVEGLFKEY